MTPRFIRTATLVVVAAASVVGIGLGSGAGVAGAAPTAPAAAATAGPGGTVTYADVLHRAADWYHRAPAYSQSTYIWDLGSTRKYRTDCSGFVDMALHLNSDPNTSAFADPANKAYFHLVAHLDLHPGSYFTPSNVHTGDFFDDTIDGHMWLFANWAPDHKHFSYYNFGGGSTGTAPPELHLNASFGDASLGYEPTRNYVQYRYTRIAAS